MSKLKPLELKALCAISKFQGKSLRDISESTGINYWTLYKTVERLRKQRVFREVNIPNFRMLGYELLVAGYGNLTKRKISELQKLREKKKIDRFSSSIFYGFAESYRGFVLGITKDYTEVKKSLITAERLVKLREMSGKDDINLVLLPLEITNIPILFDYSRLLCRAAGMECSELKGMEPRNPHRRLTRREKVAIVEITRNPNVSLNELSRKLRVTIQTASKIKRRLFEEGWIIPRIIPDLSTLGFEVMVFAHWNLNPEMVDLVNGMNTDYADISNIVFLAYDTLEGIAIAPFETLQKSREIIALFENLGSRMRVLVGEPKILFLSVQESIGVRDHDYASVLSKTFLQ